MLRSDNLFAGNGTDMSMLQRRRATWAGHGQDQRHSHESQQSSAVNNSTIEFYSMPQYMSSFNGNSVFHEMTNWSSLNADQYFGVVSPEFIDRWPAAIAPMELNSTCNLKKRKAELIEAEDREDVEIGGETRQEESEDMEKSDREISTENSKVSDYIHVRARHGQATDSHSLAERARREKINKKMKYLQDLVPGCSRITGKAGMLDEIINYVQSLQRQVEFLSMKLASLNPRLDFDVDIFSMKEFPAHVAGFPAAAALSEMANLVSLQFNQTQKEAAGCGIDMPNIPPQHAFQTTDLIIYVAYCSKLKLSQLGKQLYTPFAMLSFIKKDQANFNLRYLQAPVLERYSLLKAIISEN